MKVRLIIIVRSMFNQNLIDIDRYFYPYPVIAFDLIIADRYIKKAIKNRSKSKESIDI